MGATRNLSASRLAADLDLPYLGTNGGLCYLMAMHVQYYTFVHSEYYIEKHKNIRSVSSSLLTVSGKKLPVK